MNAKSIDDYITISQAAELMKLTRAHVWRLVKASKVKAIKMGEIYLILRESAETYDGGRPGLKPGQKINRKKKSLSTP